MTNVECANSLLECANFRFDGKIFPDNSQNELIENAGRPVDIMADSIVQHVKGQIHVPLINFDLEYKINMHV